MIFERFQWGLVERKVGRERARPAEAIDVLLDVLKDIVPIANLVEQTADNGMKLLDWRVCGVAGEHGGNAVAPVVAANSDMVDHRNWAAAGSAFTSAATKACRGSNTTRRRSSNRANCSLITDKNGARVIALRSAMISGSAPPTLDVGRTINLRGCRRRRASGSIRLSRR